MQIFTAWLTGLVFGLGLIVSGMANPIKVQAFLDLAGAWDPSLMLVMAGAIGVGIVGFAWAKRRTSSLLGAVLSWPSASHIDKRLVLGNMAFGAGWGLAGFCPGPALVAVGAFTNPAWPSALMFVAAMLLGMGLFEWMQKRA